MDLNPQSLWETATGKKGYMNAVDAAGDNLAADQQYMQDVAKKREEIRRLQEQKGLETYLPAYDSARGTLSDAYSNAQNAITGNYGQAMDLMDPYAQGGATAFSTALERALGDRGFQQEQQDLQDAISSRLSAAGLSGTSGGVEMAGDQMRRLQADQYNRSIAPLMQMGGMGQNAAGAQAGMRTNMGNTLADLYQNRGSTMSNLDMNQAATEGGIYDRSYGQANQNISEQVNQNNLLNQGYDAATQRAGQQYRDTQSGLMNMGAKLGTAYLTGGASLGLPSFGKKKEPYTGPMSRTPAPEGNEFLRSLGL